MKKAVTSIFITSDYETGLISDGSLSSVRIYRHADAAGWDDVEGVGTFHYVTYISSGETLLTDAAVSGGKAREVIFLDESKAWILDNEKYVFGTTVTSDIVLTIGSVVSEEISEDSSEGNEWGTILSAITAVAAMVVVAIIFVMRRPAR